MSLHASHSLNKKGLPFRPPPIVDVSPGHFLLIVGSRNARYLLTGLVISLAETGEVRVIDAGNPLDAPLFRHLTDARPDVLARVHLRRAANYSSLLSLLAAERVSTQPLILLDLLGPFYDGSIHLSRRREILSACLGELRRLRRAGGAVSLHPPEAPFRSARGLYRLVLSAAPRLFTSQVTLPDKSLRRLY